MRFQSVPKKYGVLLFALLIVVGEKNLAFSETSADTISVEKIQDKASNINTISSLLIQKKGHLLAEYYFNGMSERRSTNIKSASKSIISLLTGIAIEEGFIESVDQSIRPYFQDYFEANPDSIKESITIKNLLTMRSGLETTSFHNYGRWVISDNWIKFALDQPLEDQPGGEMLYSTGTSHLLSAIITKASGMSTKAFARKYLFGPLDIRPGGWDRDPQGYYMGGNNLALRPADMLKIGQMVLNNGVYQGQRMISEHWLQDTFQTYTRSKFNPYDYGYMWWKKPVGDHKVRFAWGFGGQYIFIIPALDSVVAMTNTIENISQDRSYREPIFSLLREEIIPFLQGNTEL